jgi:hypothetical protein
MFRAQGGGSSLQALHDLAARDEPLEELDGAIDQKNRGKPDVATSFRVPNQSWKANEEATKHDPANSLTAECRHVRRRGTLDRLRYTIVGADKARYLVYSNNLL